MTKIVSILMIAMMAVLLARNKRKRGSADKRNLIGIIRKYMFTDTVIHLDVFNKKYLCHVDIDNTVDSLTYYTIMPNGDGFKLTREASKELGVLYSMFNTATSVTYSIEYVVHIYREHVEEIEEVMEEPIHMQYSKELIEQFRGELARRMSHAA